MSTFSNNVRFVRPEVSLLTPRWIKIRDCLDGAVVVGLAAYAWSPVRAKALAH